MILIEWLRAAVWYVCRFFVWFFTARDCKHCKHGSENPFFEGYICYLPQDKKEKCLRCCTRPFFERDREERA